MNPVLSGIRTIPINVRLLRRVRIIAVWEAVMARLVWVRNAVKWHGQFLKARSTQQPSRCLDDRETLLFAFCRARDERDGIDYLRIAAEGTEEEVERAYHRIVDGRAGTVMATPIEAIEQVADRRISHTAKPD